MGETKLEKEQDFKVPLGLIAYKYVKVTFDDSGELTKEEKIKVPPETDFVHIAVTTVDMCLGSAQHNKKWYFSRLRFQTVVNELRAPNLKYTIKAQLISDKPDDVWNGTIWLSIMCFGKVPVP